MWVSLWLKRVAVAAVVVTISASIPGIFRMQQITLSLFMGKGEGIFISWASALIVGGLTTALGCFILYFSMNALASILRVLMEMEFNSRDSS